MKVSSPDHLMKTPSTSLSFQSRNSGCMPGPPSIKYIIIKYLSQKPNHVLLLTVSEACERFGYYALRSILFLYLTEELLFVQDTALAICTGTMCLGYFSPVMGGYISDSFWGKYKTIVVFSLLYVASAGLLAYSAVNKTQWMAIAGLVGIAVAMGGIKPCVSAFGADQLVDQSNGALDTYFSVFYMSINIASLFAFLIIPVIRSNGSYFVAFAVPAVLIFISIIIFMIPSPRYHYVEPTGSLLARLWPTIVYVFWTNPSDPNRIVEAEIRFGIEEARMVEALTVVIPVFMFFPMFWCVYDLQSGAWQAQAKLMNLQGFELEQIGALNTAFLLLLLPLLDKCIYPQLKRAGCRTDHISRIYVGLAAALLGMGVVTMLQYKIDLDPSDKISIFYQTPQYFLMALAEALVSVTGLTYAYENAPMELKTVISSINLTTTAFGNLLSTIIFATSGFVGNVSLLQKFMFFLCLIGINMAGFRCYTSARDLVNSKKHLDDSDRETRELLEAM